MRSAAIILSGTLALGQAQQPSSSSKPPSFRLFFLGHEIGREDDTGTQCSVHFEDRGTAIDLQGAIDPSTLHLAVKGRNYRLFASDSEVTLANGRAHVRDLTRERDVDLQGKPFFPIDNYAPFCVQEQLIKFWLANGRPAVITSPPSGEVRITQRAQIEIDDRGVRDGRVVGFGLANWQLLRLTVDGVVWGRETAWVEKNSHELIAVTTWAGALPFEAVRSGYEDLLGRFLQESSADRIADLEQLTARTPIIQSNTFALVGGRVIAGEEMAPIENATIVVRDGRISSFGPSSAILVPRTVPVVDVRGKTIIPGLWDMHAHASQIDWAPVYLASGVTTIRDMGGEEGFLIAIRDAIKSGRAFGPRYLLAGLVDGPGPRAFGAVTAATPDEGRAVVRRYRDEGFEQIKIYSLVAPDVVKAIVDEAHKLGMTVTGHVPSGMTSQSVVEAGFDQIAHMQLRGASGSEASKQQIAFFKAHNTVMDPTESWNELSGRPAATPLESLLPGVSRLPTPLARMFASMTAGNGDPQAVHARLIDSVKLLKDAVDAGLLVVAGTDKGVPGFSLQRELELYVEGGMTPVQALQTATTMPALAMGLARDVGTIEAGKRADFVVLDGNPLEKMSNIRTARMVAANGRLYDCDVLWRAAGFLPRDGRN